MTTSTMNVEGTRYVSIIPLRKAPIEHWPLSLDSSDPMPLPVSLYGAAAVLDELGYDAARAERVLRHVACYKTAECCSAIRSEADREAIEAALDRDVAWNGPEWDAHRYNPTDAALDATHGDAAAAYLKGA